MKKTLIKSGDLSGTIPGPAAIENLENTSPFDTFLQMIEGRAIVIVDGTSKILTRGNGMLILAHQKKVIKPYGKIKLLVTVVKKGYEDCSVG